MSPRDLPLWARAASGGLLVVGAWLASSSDALRGAIGPWLVPMVAGIIAGSIVLGMRLPLELWPRAPRRRRFSLPITIGIGAVLAGTFALADRTTAPNAVWQGGIGLVLPVLAGAGLWAVAWGRIQQSPFVHWYVRAVLAAALPFAVAVVASAWGDRRLEVWTVLQSAGLWIVVMSSWTLVTQELAFRRLLIGQSGDAGGLMVLGAAALSAVWGMFHSPLGFDPGTGFTIDALAGVVAGSLYLLSRSLLIPALFTGVFLGMLTAATAAATDTSAVIAEWGGLPLIGGLSVVAIWLMRDVVRRAGWRGAMHNGMTDASDD